MISKVKDVLRLLEFSEKEVCVYVQLLKLQKAALPQLRNACGLPNITVYRILNLLEEKKLVQSIALNGKQKIYSPLTLENLTKMISVEQRKLRHIELELRNLDGLLPYLGDETTSLPDIDIRTGFDAFREEYLKMPDIFQNEYLHIGNCTKFWDIAKLNYDVPEERWFINRRMNKNLFARALDIRTPVTETIRAKDSREKRTMKFAETLPIKNDFLMIAENQVTHFINDKENPRVIVIRTPELVRTHLNQFEHLWKAAA